MFEFFFFNFKAENTSLVLNVSKKCKFQNKLQSVQSPRNQNGESSLFWTPLFMLLGGSHFDGHIWGLVNVPLDFARSINSICTDNHYHLLFLNNI